MIDVIFIEFSKDDSERFDVGENYIDGKLISIDIDEEKISLIFDEEGEKIEKLYFINNIRSISKRLE
jgi:predicted RNA-binding protein